MDLFNILKRKKEEIKLDIPPPPPIPKPIAREEPKLFLPKIPEVPEFKPSMPEFPTPKFFEAPKLVKLEIPKPISIPKPEFRPIIKTERIIPKFQSVEVKESKPLEKSYIKAESLRDIMENVNGIKEKIKESEDVLTRLNEIKNREDKEFEKWNLKFEDVQRKLIYIDKTFFGG